PGFWSELADGGVEREDAPLPGEQLERVRDSHDPTLPGELPDALDRAAQRRVVEDVRSRVRDVVEGPVERAASGGGVCEVADGDRVADGERRRLIPCEQASDGARIPERRLV